MDSLSELQALLGDYENPNITSDLAAYDPDLFDPPYPVWPLAHSVPGTTIRVAAGRSTVIQGTLNQSFFDDFYERVHISPLEIDLGNITPPQTRQVEVWNAFLIPKNLISIDADGVDDGLSFDPAPPMTFQPLQAVVFTLTADVDVPPAIDVYFDFIWEAADSPPVHVVGVSVIPVPWRQRVPMQETLGWLTDVMTSIDGSEQATSLRQTPRQSYAVGLYSRDFSGIQHAFVGGYGRGYAVPTIDEGKPCSVLSGSSEVLIDTSQGDWREMVMIWVEEDDFEIIEIDEVLADRLVLKRPTTATRTGTAYPCAAARISAPPVRTTFARPGGSMLVTFEFTRTRDLASGAEPTQWQGYDVLLTCPKLNPLDDTLEQRIETLDNRTGWPVDDRYWDRAKITRPMRWIVERGEAWTLRRWLHRRRGQWRPFWHPSFEHDFTVTGSGAINTLLVVKANGYEKYGKTRSLALVTQAGEWVFADITGVVDAGGGNIGLQLDQTLVQTHADIQRVSLMGLKRLASDNVTINHIGLGRSEVLAEFMEFTP